MAAFEIPLLPATPQALSISILNVPYQFTVKWCSPASSWLLDIADAQSVPIVSGIPLVTGADLLEQFEYLGLGVALYAQSLSHPSDPPTFDNLGDNGKLYFVTP